METKSEKNRKGDLKMEWELHYKLNKEEAAEWDLPEVSDVLGYIFLTRIDAQRFARELQSDPERHGHCGWLADAAIWAEPVPARE